MTPVVDKTLEREPSSVGIPWVTMGWFATLLALCYLPVLVRLVNQWNNDEDMSHGFFVPVLAGYIAWQNRDKFLAEPARPNGWGLALVIYAALQVCVATLGAELFLARTAIVLSLIGSVWFLGGTRRLYILAFPLFLLFFMLVLIWLSVPYAARSWAILERSQEASGLPFVFALKTLIPLFALLMALQGIAQAIRAAAVLARAR